jgi:YtkA-like
MNCPNSRVKLTGTDGAAITGAQVTVTFFMPAMPAMGMAAMRSVATLSEKGGGIYERPGEVQREGLGKSPCWQPRPVRLSPRNNSPWPWKEACR